MRSKLVFAVLSSCYLVANVLAQDPDGGSSGGEVGEEHSGGDPDEKIKIAHAALASTAWVFFFPLGSILIRTLHTSKSVWIHAGIQAFATVLFTVAVGLGIRIALDKGEIGDYHPVIGLVVFSVLFVQAAGGIIHHLLYRKRGHRTIVSYAHIWLGRTLITLGMINGGLGLLLAADATRGEYIAYGVVAGFVWLVWVAVDIQATVRQRRAQSVLSKEEKKKMSS